ALRTLGLDPEQIRDRLCVTKDCIDEHHGGPAAYVISANIHRRHLTTEQKRELITKLIKAAPEKSDRQIAAAAKVDHKTVGVARARVEGRGEIPHVEERTDTKGRKQPARKQPRARAKTNWKIDDERARAKTKRKIDDERKSLVRRLTEADRGLVVLLSSFFEKYPDQINAFVNDVWFSAAEIGPEASAEVMKTKRRLNCRRKRAGQHDHDHRPPNFHRAPPARGGRRPRPRTARGIERATTPAWPAMRLRSRAYRYRRIITMKT